MSTRYFQIPAGAVACEVMDEHLWTEPGICATCDNRPEDARFREAWERLCAGTPDFEGDKEAVTHSYPPAGPYWLREVVVNCVGPDGPEHEECCRRTGRREVPDLISQTDERLNLHPIGPAMRCVIEQNQTNAEGIEVWDEIDRAFDGEGMDGILVVREEECPGEDEIVSCDQHCTRCDGTGMVETREEVRR